MEAASLARPFLAPSASTSNIGTSAETNDELSEMDADLEGVDELDAEIDQLDSDSTGDEAEYELDSDDGKDESLKVSGKRVPGHTVLPADPINMIIEDTLQKPSIPMAPEAIFAISIATEEFLKKLIQAGQRQAVMEGRQAIHYSDISGNTQQYQEFMFLKDTIPSPMSLSEALERRADHEKEVLEAQPAMTAGGQIETSAAPVAPGPSHPPPKPKPRRSTGRARNSDTKYRDRKAAGPSTATRIGPPRSTRGVKLAHDWADDDDDDVMYPSPSMNGSVPPSTSRSRGAPLAPETLGWEDDEEPHANGHSYPESASHNAMDDSVDTNQPPFQPPVGNPGRTIYSPN